MAQPPNVYRIMAFELHPKISAYLDQLNQNGQIDLDADGFPYLLGLTREGPNFVIKISRNNAEQTILCNTRRQADPVANFPEDGWVRPGGGKQVIVVQQEEDPNAPRKERMKRTAFESFEKLARQIIDQ